MASEAYTVEEIQLRDGETADLLPLAIFDLRKFMRIWSDCLTKTNELLAEAQKKMQEDEATAVSINNVNNQIQELQWDAFVKMCAFGLTEIKARKEFTDKQFADYLEKTLDEASIFKILDATGNLKLGPDAPNPNPAVMKTDQDGTN